ncbi:MAG: CAP domain-containing protein [Hyphomicrobiaceae bacterium]|nr:CAP domain-containing protein [Hyphomicrobiaceae bacterium]
MFRVIGLLVVAVTVSACSLGNRPVMFGYNGAPGAGPDRGVTGGSLGGTPRETASPTPKNRRTAALDRAGAGRYKKAPKGALADRDYSRTRLVASEALRMINSYRRKHGLRPLKLDVLLTKAAKAHSTDLAKWDRISHYGSDGSNPWDRVRRTGYKARLAAENVGTGQASLAEVFEGWRKSPGHNKNLLLRDATQMGIALVQDPKTEFKTFWTLVLATPG